MKAFLERYLMISGLIFSILGMISYFFFEIDALIIRGFYLGMALAFFITCLLTFAIYYKDYQLAKIINEKIKNENV